MDEKTLDELERLEREATERGSSRWVRTSDRKDGTAQVYSPSLGPMRVIVPVAETTEENADFIAALRNAAPALIRAARFAAKAETWLRAHGPTALGDLTDMNDQHGARALEVLLTALE